MKKKALFLFTTGLSILLCACSTSTGRSAGGAKTEISLSNIREAENTESSTKSDTPKPNADDNSTKVSLISNDLLKILGNDKNILMDALHSADGVEVEESEDGIHITTTSSFQREAVIGMLSDEVKSRVESLRESGIRINYDIANRYIDIYCSSNDSESVTSAINNMIGVIASGQEINDNSTEWSVFVTINDADSGDPVKRVALSSENSTFSLETSDWNLKDGSNTNSDVPEGDEESNQEE